MDKRKATYQEFYNTMRTLKPQLFTRSKRALSTVKVKKLYKRYLEEG